MTQPQLLTAKITKNVRIPPQDNSMDKQFLCSKRLLVVGDSMLDRYWFGDANRISPEAPVPVVRVVKSENRLGGAANVALNITSVGAKADLMSVIGEDDAGTTLAELLRNHGIGSRLYTDAKLKTTVKLRIIARQQQMVRVDFEDHPATEVLSALTGAYEQILSHYDAIVLSDYGKGGLDHITRMIELARAQRIPVLIDPKGTNYDRYAGADIITPNRAELAQVVGHWSSEQDLTEKAQALRTRLNITAILLTRSEEGMTLFSEQGTFSVPAQAREVYDVSGAGDTVIAVLSTMLAAKAPLEQAVVTANQAGGIVVGKLGTATVTFEEIFGA